MKKKLLYMNIVLMMAVIFTSCYQSIHAFSHALKNNDSHYEAHHHSDTFTSKVQVTEKEECPICDFDFAAFLPMQMLDIAFYKHIYQKKIPLILFETISAFSGSAINLRGPPILNYY